MSVDVVTREPTASLAGRIPRHLFQRSLLPSMVGVARTWLAIVLCWWAVGELGPWVVLPAMLLIGTLQYHLNVLGHDGLHYLLSNKRPINDALCRWLLHGPHGAPLGAMRRNHLNHHTQFGSDADLDRQYYDTRRFSSAAAFRMWLVGALLGGMTLPIARKLLGRGRSGAAAAVSMAQARQQGRALDLTSVVVSQAWIAVSCWLLTGWWFAYLPLWLLPLLTVMMGLNSLRSCLEHAQPASGQPGLHSFSSNLLERFFLSPFNMNVHAEHHLVPAVPWHHLPGLRQFLQQEGHYGCVTLIGSYRSRAAALAAAMPAT